jgi:transcriptional regulator with GAF, ATPase, and Fis domain
MSELVRSLEARRLMDGLASQAVAVCEAALVRVWLIGPGDECASCPMLPECANQIRCLHLAASAGATTRLDGAFHRFPIGAREVGNVALSGAAWAVDADLATLGLADASWLAAHHVRSFAAVPLECGTRILGVLAVFSRRDLSEHEVRLLGLAAKLAAHAIEAVASPAAAPLNERRRGAAAPNAGHALMTIAEAQREAIERALAAADGRVSGAGGAAALLGMHANTLISRMIRLGMRKRARRK